LDFDLVTPEADEECERLLWRELGRVAPPGGDCHEPGMCGDIGLIVGKRDKSAVGSWRAHDARLAMWSPRDDHLERWRDALAAVCDDVLDATITSGEGNPVRGGETEHRFDPD